MYDASSDARNSTAYATSSTLPSRFIGTALSVFARHSGSADILDVRIAGRMPGCTEFTRTPSLAYCTAADLVMRRSEEHTSELQSRFDLVCRLLLEKK